MKKYNIYKILGIVIVLTILISYFIPQTSISYGAVTKGDLNPVSIIDTLSNSITSFNVFISPFIYILIIGIFYGILKKTGKYGEVVNNVAANFNNNHGLFVIISILFFGIITAVIGDILPLLVFVPFMMDIIVKLGYKKPVAVVSTLGAILLGSAGSLNTNVINQILKTTVSTNVLFKVLILFVSLISLIVFVLIFNTPAKKEKIEKVKSNKQLPIIITLSLILIFIIIGMTSWSEYFGFKGFEEAYKSITDFKLLKVSIFKAFVGGSVAAFGAWQIFDVFVLIGIFSIILCFIYKIKFDEILEVCASSIKKALPYAFIVIIANIVLVNAYSSGWYMTVVKNLAGTKFNLPLGIITSMLSSIVYPDYSYGLQFTLTTIIYSITKSKDFYEILAITYQSIYSTVLLVSPTSILILLGLYHLNIKFIDWLKFIWKYFIIVLVSNIIIISILSSGFNVPVILAIIIVLVISFGLIYKRILNIKEEIKDNEKKPKKVTTKKKTNKK